MEEYYSGVAGILFRCSGLELFHGTGVGASGRMLTTVTTYWTSTMFNKLGNGAVQILSVILQTIWQKGVIIHTSHVRKVRLPGVNLPSAVTPLLSEWVRAPTWVSQGVEEQKITDFEIHRKHGFESFLLKHNFLLDYKSKTYLSKKTCYSSLSFL